MFNLSSAFAFNLVTSKILSFGKGLKAEHTRHTVKWRFYTSIKSIEPGQAGLGLNFVYDTRQVYPMSWSAVRQKWILEIPNYSITCIRRPLKGSNESGLLHQVVFKCSSYSVDLRWVVASEQWSLKAGGLLVQGSLTQV